MANCSVEGRGEGGARPLTYAGPVGGELEAGRTLAAVAARAVEAVRVPLTQAVAVAALVDVCKSNKSTVTISLLC